MFRNGVSRYNALSIALHWAMFLLIAVVYACIELREIFPRGSDPREALKQWHFTLGLTVLLLVLLRIAIRLLSGPAPRIDPAPPPWQRVLALTVHLSLYGLMLLMPIAGWLILSSAGKDIPFWGLELPPLISRNEATADWIEEVHETAGAVGYGLIGLHAAAGLLHHYVLRDNTLLRMLPGRSDRQVLADE